MESVHLDVLYHIIIRISFEFVWIDGVNKRVLSEVNSCTPQMGLKQHSELISDRRNFWQPCIYAAKLDDKTNRCMCIFPL